MATAEQAEVERFTADIIQQAERDADLVASFLEANGIAPQAEPAATQVDEAPVDTATGRRARAFLLDLAGALRVASWRRAGLGSHLPADLPSTEEAALETAAQAAAQEREEPASTLATKVFHTWLWHFVHGGQGTLQRDVVLDRQALDPDALLDRLADLLWRNRHLLKTEDDD